MTDIPRRSSTRTKKHTATLDEIQDIIWVLLIVFLFDFRVIQLLGGSAKPFEKR